MRNPFLINRTSGKWTRLFAAESESRPGKFYYVGHSDAGEWACSCPAWIYHTPRRDCKHIRATRALLERATIAINAPLIKTPAVAPEIQIRAEAAFDAGPTRATFIELD